MTRELLFSVRKVILDGMRKVILDVDTYPWKLLNMSFSPLNSRHLLTALGGGGWGGVFEPFPYFSNPVYTRMVHLLISGTETMLRYILWRQSTLLLTKSDTKWQFTLFCRKISSDKYEICQNIFCIFWHPSSWPICQILMYLLRSRATKPSEIDWIWRA